MQLLYQLEINPEEEPGAVERFWRGKRASRQAKAFAATLVEATQGAQVEIDRRIGAELEQWRLERLSVVVRNLLRMAVCEMVVLGDVPFQVVINEAVDLARDFMDDDSARFVNSVLEKCRLASPPHGGEGPASAGGG